MSDAIAPISRRAGPRSQRFWLRRAHVTCAAQAADITLIAGIGAGLTALATAGMAVDRSSYAAVIIAAAVLGNLAFARVRLYTLESLAAGPGLRAVAARWTTVFLALAAFSALTHLTETFSRLWFCGFYAAGLAGLAAGRVAWTHAIRGAVARGYVTRAVASYGDLRLGEQVAGRLAGTPCGVRLTERFADTPAGLAALLAACQAGAVETVIVALPAFETARIAAAIQALRHAPVNLRVLPGELGLAPVMRGLALPAGREERAELPGICLIAVADRPISDTALLVKGALDRALAAAGLVILAPLLAVCAAGILVSSPGPVLFRQDRVGFAGQKFRIWKFRTLHCKAPGGLVQRGGDSRIFGFGRLLRATSADELPQLINVLRGEMSLVGPRPHMVGQTVEGVPFFDAVYEYAGRHRVKPGITGWAQVNGFRGSAETRADIERRVEHDIFYIENWSLGFDLLILAKTVCGGFVGRNAF
jgi:putative colanic acid biosynthesis UDP-glucose lipid carrier transferase